MSTTVSSHLESPAARGLSEPDVVLLVGDSRFPVHSAVVSRGSGLLRQLLSEFGGGGGGGGAPAELRLFSADGVGAPGSTASSEGIAAAAALNREQVALVSNPSHFPAYLARLYSPTGTAALAAGFNAAAARPLLVLADFFDSPQLLPEIDNCLVASLSERFTAGMEAGLLRFSNVYGASSRTRIFSDQLRSWLELAMEFKLRRVMSEVLFVLSIGHLIEHEVAGYVRKLDAGPLAALAKHAIENRPISPVACSAKCADGCSAATTSVCKSCKDAIIQRRPADVDALEKGLLESGWGYART